MKSTTDRRLALLGSTNASCICGYLVVLAALAIQLYLAIEIAKKDTAPASRMLSTWLWIVSPYLTNFLVIIPFRRRPRAIAVLAIGSLLCLLLGYVVLWMDGRTVSIPGGMNPIGGGGGSMLSLVIAGLFQWILLVITLGVAVFVTVLGARPKSIS